MKSKTNKTIIKKQKNKSSEKKSSKKKTSKKKSSKNKSSKFNIMTWNVLTRKATQYRWKSHNYFKKLNEHMEQTLQRYKIILNNINKYKPHILCLQEFDYNLFYYLKKHLDTKYNILFQPNPSKTTYYKHDTYGTSIIWDKTRFTHKKEISVNINDKLIKSATQKNSTIILFFDKKTKKTFNCVSIHLAGNNKNEVDLLINETFKNINNNYPIIICGDFNCRHNVTNCLKKYKEFKNLKMFKFKKNDHTTCTFDYDNKYPKSLIDGIYFTNNIKPTSYNIGKKSCKIPIYKKTTKNNYSDIKLGSDHFWIKASLVIN